MTPTPSPVDAPSPHEIGWGRAIAEGVLAVVAAFVLLVWIPNLMLTRLSGVARTTRVAVATVWFSLALVAMAWAGRRLQAHHVV